jgi:Uma2 family endonuclease
VTSSWPPLLEPDVVSPGRPITLEEWLAQDEDGEGEFVDGRLVEEEVPDAVHELAVAWLIRTLGVWLEGTGFVMGSELKVLTARTRGRKPDVVVFLPGTPPPPRRGPIRQPPDILVEIVTPSPRDERRDRVEKMAEYASFGVRHYWLLDPALGTFEVFSLNDAGTYSKSIGATAGAVGAIPGCAGLTVDLDALWAELRKLPEV